MEEIYPLSFSQQRLWFFEQFHPGSATYNVHSAFELHGFLKIESLRWAINEMVLRHASFRTSFRSIDGIAKQCVVDSCSFDLRMTDVTELSDEAISELLATEIKIPFDLSCPPLLRVTLFQKSESHFFLLIVMHHLISDGWSMGIYNRELSHLYECHLQNDSSRLSPLELQYFQFAENQRMKFQEALLEDDLRYWNQKLGKDSTALNLPLDQPRPNVFNYRGSSIRKMIGDPVKSELQKFSNQNQVTLYMMLLSAFNVLLMRYSNQKDILIGTPVAGRQDSSTESLIGFFVNILLIRTDLKGDPTFRELLQRIRQTTLEAYEHQNLPFDFLMEKLYPERSLSYSPLFPVLFALQNAPEHPLQMKNVSVHPLPWIDTGHSKFDWTILFSNTNSGLEMRVVYSDVFSATTMLRMSEHFQNLLEGILKNPDAKISSLPLIGKEERNTVVENWNQTKTEYPRDVSIPYLVEQMANEFPQSIAVQSGDYKLSYHELNYRAGLLAKQLLRRGVEQGAIVGVCLERSADFVISCLAVLKAGGAYLPLDPESPTGRMEVILSDTHTRFTIARKKFESKLPAAIEIVFLENLTDEDKSETSLFPPTAATELAYVIHTSGSTGNPKGVAATHRAVIRLARNTNYIRIHSTDVIGQAAHISFDATTFEMWGALLNGARLVIIPQPVLLSPSDLTRKIIEDGITILFLTTSLFQSIVQQKPDAFRSLSTLLVGGETMNPEGLGLFEKYMPERFINVYGPTEGTTFSTWHLIDKVPKNGFSVPIGRPISNTTVYILDDFLQPLPIGIPGEIFIGGDGVANGYINQPDLTDLHFKADPFQNSGQLYKTGDLGKWRPDGTIEFLGRADGRMKIRGFLVEPAEVENAIQQFEGVRNCAVIAIENQSESSTSVVAYVVAVPDFQPDNLRIFLRTKLPQYMIPDRIIPIDSLPLNPAGKIDRNQLPKPDRIRDSTKVLVEARDALDSRLIEIWQKILRISPIGINDDFFDLGGHSLHAVQLFAEIRKITNKDLPLVTLFETPTIEGLSRRLHDQKSFPNSSSLVAIRPSGLRPPLFFVHSLSGNVLAYRALAKHLASDRPIYGLQSIGLDRRDDPLWTIQEMASHYVNEIRKAQQIGPYYIAGASMGGVIAFEMACQIRKQNQEVKFLGILDSSMHRSHRKNNGNNHGGPVRAWNEFFKSTQSFFLSLRRDLRLAKDDYRIMVQMTGLRFALMASKSFGIDLWRRMRRVRTINLYAFRHYVPDFYNGQVTFFSTSGEPSRFPIKDWSSLCEKIEVHLVPGDHESMLNEPDVQVLAQELTKCLGEA